MLVETPISRLVFTIIKRSTEGPNFYILFKNFIICIISNVIVFFFILGKNEIIIVKTVK